MIRVIVIGGTSGLGLELTKIFAEQSILNPFTFIKVIATGRHDPKHPQFAYRELDLTSPYLGSNLSSLVRDEGRVDLLIYAAGYYQAKTIDKLTDAEIQNMCAVGIEAPAMLLSRILEHQESLPGLIYISSTSAWKPRPNEPVYAAVKAGSEHLVRSLSESQKINKALIAAPAGLKGTNFYSGTKRDNSKFLDSKWVANQIVDYFLENEFNFQCIDILNDPPRVEERKEREKRQLLEIGN